MSGQRGQRNESSWKGREEAKVQALWFIQVRQLKGSNLKIIPTLQPPRPRQLSTFRMARPKPSQQLWGEALMLILQVNFNPFKSFASSSIQIFPRSYNHMITGCRKIHTERLGRNPVSGSKNEGVHVFNICPLQVGASGQKVSCERCGSFDHLAGACKFQDSAQVTVSLNELLKVKHD